MVKYDSTGQAPQSWNSIILICVSIDSTRFTNGKFGDLLLLGWRFLLKMFEFASYLEDLFDVKDNRMA